MWAIAASVAVILAIFGMVTVAPALRGEATPYVRPSDAFSTPSLTPEPKPVAVFIGDSYTQGAGGEGGFVPIVCRELRWVCTNLGVGGTSHITNPVQQTAAEAQIACGRDYCPSYREVIAEAAAANPAFVVVNGGRNMEWADPQVITDSVQLFYDELTAAVPNATIITVSPIWDDDVAPANMEQIKSIVRTVSDSKAAVFVDIGEPLAGRPDLIVDGVHPNQQGYELIAQAILAVI